MRAKSEEDFASIVKKRGCTTVTARAYQRAKGGVRSRVVGVIADFQYVLELNALTPAGRSVVYREVLFEQYGSECGVADAENRSNANTRHNFLVRQRVEELKGKLPGVPITLET